MTIFDEVEQQGIQKVSKLLQLNFGIKASKLI